MRKCVLIINPNSGRHINKEYLYKYQKILTEHDYEMIVYFTMRPKHAVEIVENLDSADLVISLGGDGTFNEVVTGNLRRKEPFTLAHIPIGTTNDIGNMLGYGKDIIHNLKLLMEGSIKKIDICTINTQPFVYVTGFGKFMTIPYETSREMKSRFGHLAYILEAIKHFGIPTKLYEISFEIDGKKYIGQYSFLLISNANRIAGINEFYKDIKLNDGLFEVAMCKLTKKSDIIKSLYQMAINNIDSAKGFEFYKLNKLELTFQNIPRNIWNIDGEKLDDESLTYEIKIERNLNILIPKKNIKKLFTAD